MTPAELKELEKALTRHANWLHRSLNSPERESLDLHLQIAGQLRVLLCDGELPILIRYARERGVPLRVWGPRSPRQSAHPPLFFAFYALVASWDKLADAYEMSIEEFLDPPIGVASVAPADGLGPGSPYTPRQVIKWAANKEGVAHLDLDKPATLESLKASQYRRGEVVTEEMELRRVLYQIADWALHAIDHVLPDAA